MRYFSHVARILVGLSLAVFFAFFAVLPSRAQVSILTQHNDNSRTGDNLNETILNTSNVNVGQFGKLFTCPVDGFIYAQPLYMSDLTISGTAHNVVFVATEHDSVYAFDADTGAQLWKTSLGTSVPSTDYGGYTDLVPEIGITGTPVIDPNAATMFLDAFTKDTNGNYHHYLHALNITTGQDINGSPVEITGSVPGTSWDSSNGVLAFDPFQHLQRPALLLSDGTLYVCFGSHGDYEPYHGWVFAYSESTLTQQAIYCTTPNGQEGGIWMGGQGPVADATGNVYVMVGNSDENYENNPADYGESFVKLGLSGNSLSELDYFKPNNYDTLNAYDEDLGSAGPMLIPGTGNLVGGGKEGVLYLVDTTTGDMGGLNLNQDQMLQEFQATDPEIDQSPIYWNSPVSGPTIYVWGSYGDVLKAYNMTNGLFNTTPFSEGPIVSPGLPGGCLSLSANGSTSGTGIIWASHAYNADANPQTVRGELDAYDATNLTTPLWTSVQNASRDDVGNCAKFAPPTVANGRVYLGTFSKQLDVYGLLALPTSLSPSSATVGSPGFAITVNGAGFSSGSVVDWNGTALTTTFVSATQLTAAVPASDIAAVAPVTVTVVNPGAKASSGLAFTISPVPAATLTSLSPTSAQVGAGGFTLTINGTGFLSGCVANWNSSPLATTFVSTTQVTATVPTSDLVSVVPVKVTVTNAGANASNSLAFTIQALHTFPQGLQLFSVPYDYSEYALFVVLGYSNPILAVWSPASSSYAVTPVSPADVLRLGQGYWARFPQPVSLNAAGALAPTNKPFSVALTKGWNMIGDPFPISVDMSSLIVMDSSGAQHSFAAAVQTGLVGPTLYSYPANAQAYSSQTSGTLDPYAGYWIVANQNCTLLIPAPAL